MEPEIHTVEPLFPESSFNAVEIATEKLKRYKSPGIDLILAEPLHQGTGTLQSHPHKLVVSIRNEEVFPHLGIANYCPYLLH
jgi:hypothetical protein